MYYLSLVFNYIKKKYLGKNKSMPNKQFAEPNSLFNFAELKKMLCTFIKNLITFETSNYLPNS